MKRKMVIAGMVTLSLVSVLVSVVPAFADPNEIASFWMPDPLFPGKVNPNALKHAQPGDQVPGYWWRDTTNQNAIADFYDTQYSQQQVIDVGHDTYLFKGYSKTDIFAAFLPAGVIIVDSGDSVVDAQAVRALVDAMSGGKPILALFLTSSSYDRVTGWREFLSYNPDGTMLTQVGISTNFPARYNQILVPLRPEITRRYRMILGAELPYGPDGRLGPEAGAIDPPVTPPLPPPYMQGVNLLWVPADRSVVIGGLTLQLLTTPSRTDDAISVFIPSYGIVITGDTLSPYFLDPGPLTDAGGATVREWLASLNKLKNLPNVVNLVSTSGTTVVNDAVEARFQFQSNIDLLNYLYSEVIALGNQGKTLDDIIAQIALPPNLAQPPYSQELQNNIPSAIKAIYHECFGWFDGNPVELTSTLPTAGRAQIIADLAGGLQALIEKAQKAELEAGDLPGAEKALFLAHAAYEATPADSERLDQVERIYAQTLRKNAFMQKSDQIRNYYLSLAQELDPQP